MIPQDLDKISRSMLREISEGKEAERSDFVMRERKREQESEIRKPPTDVTYKIKPQTGTPGKLV